MGGRARAASGRSGPSRARRRSPVRPWWLLLFALCSAARAGGDFPRPPELEPDVRFWTRVYTEVDSQAGLIHDARRLGVVYETLHLPKGLGARAQQRRIDRHKKRLRQTLRRLAGGRREGLSSEAQRVLHLWPKGVDRRTLEAAATRLRFQRGQADRFRAGIERSGAWTGAIRASLRAAGVPGDLAYLPHVESSYHPYARSRRGAAGLWQFTRLTGRRYLRVDTVVDERLDPLRATRAAARLLGHNYRITGSWPLAITAYNHGLAGVRRALRRLGTRDIAKIVRGYRGRGFGFASRNFYVAFLAARDVARHPQRYFGTLHPAPPRRAPSVTLSELVEASALAAALGVSSERLAAANPSLRLAVWSGAKYVPRGFQLRLPAGVSPRRARLALAALPASARHAEQRPDRHYRVRPGETLSGIARRHGTRVDTLVALNGLASGNRIRAGRVLRLPVAGRPASPAGSATAAARTYLVRRGDTLGGIARRLGVTQGLLASANRLSDRNRIYPGQMLKVATTSTPSTPASGHTGRVNGGSRPAAGLDGGREAPSAAPSLLEDAAPPALAADPSDYTVAADGSIEVQAAETLGHYADWLDLSARELRRLNRLRYGQPLVIGRRLRLDFSRVSRSELERRRIAYHQALQSAFFARHPIAGTCQHRLERGESLWSLAAERFGVPVWLLRQYNPGLDFTGVHPDTPVTIPVLAARNDGDDPPQTVSPVC